MLSIPVVLKKILRNNPFLEENLSLKIINYSALARRIRPEVEKELLKKVKTGGIVMALKRMSGQMRLRSSIKKIFKTNTEMILRSNLVEFTFLNSDLLLEKHKNLLKTFDTQEKYFLTVTRGVFETTIIASFGLREKIKNIFKEEKIVSEFTDLSSITIRLPKESIHSPGVYYFILKSLAWENINIIEVVSTSTELTLILDSKEIDRAFSILKNLLSQ